MDRPLTVPQDAGERIHRLVERLYPICRSLTGNGVRETLAVLAGEIPLEVHEVPTGTRVFDWTIPREWNIRDAYILDGSGNRVVDFRASNLHVVGYSVPIRRRMTLEELEPHLHTLPETPDWIPYRTSYYNETWGFCLSENQRRALGPGTYEVVVDSTLEPGSLTYAECFLPGASPQEVLFFTHVCHPSLCNDNLSGIGVTTFLARALQDAATRYSYRFIFAPATLGSITWLSRNRDRWDRIRNGLVVSNVGDPGPLTYKRSRRGDAEVDRAVQQVLRQSGHRHNVVEFTPWGYDERQFGSPGVNLPVGRLTRTPNGAYPEYHTSADDLNLIRPESLEDSLSVLAEVIGVLEGNRRYRNLSPYGEPQLGKRGLYRTMGGHRDIGRRENALLWVLNLSDGRHSLLDVCERSGLAFDEAAAAAADLCEAGLLEDLTMGETR